MTEIIEKIPDWETSPAPWYLRLRFWLAMKLIGRHGLVYHVKMGMPFDCQGTFNKGATLVIRRNYFINNHGFTAHFDMMEDTRYGLWRH